MKTQQEEIQKPLYVSEDPTTWECFKAVSDVLGEEDAEYELKKVLYKHLDGCEELRLEDNKGLMQAFVWAWSPQGFSFWGSVSEGRFPEEYKKDLMEATKKPDNIEEGDSEPVVEAFIPTPTLSIGDAVKQLEMSLSGSENISVVFDNGTIALYHSSGIKVDVTEYDAKGVTECAGFLSKYGEKIVAVSDESDLSDVEEEDTPF